MKKDMHQALSADGDVGPDGANLTKTYNGDDRCMMVATVGDPPQVVGCCAVKRGMDSTKIEAESSIGSIWRMSVDPSARGKGIATKLMTACESWARQNGCKSMGLWTVNPVAANFYVKRMGYQPAEQFYFFDFWLAKQFIPPAVKYTKSLFPVAKQ